MNMLREVIYDDDNYRINIDGFCSDDTPLIEIIKKMQKADMKVHCQTPDASFPKEKLMMPGYKHEGFLLDKLLGEYLKRTGEDLRYIRR